MPPRALSKINAWEWGSNLDSSDNPITWADNLSGFFSGAVLPKSLTTLMAYLAHRKLFATQEAFRNTKGCNDLLSGCFTFFNCWPDPLEMIGMNIQNLESNILFFICDSLNGHSENGSAMIKDVLEDFSDIPESELLSAVKAMVDEGLITTSSSRACLSITEKGINRVQSSIACRVNNFDHCQCGQDF
jgi:hypothetical protein